ncbi:MAG: SpoIIE family protein phosphatase [Chloroflexi bacterium]|nr:SpoIIE family protein phosphatase [Chloroflexota bacterium]
MWRSCWYAILSSAKHHGLSAIIAMNSNTPSKNRPKSRLRFSIATKLLASFLLLFVVSFATVGVLVTLDMKEIGSLAEESSIALGNSATSDSTSALEELGEAAIKQKAIDVSKQVKIYLEGHPELTTEEIGQDTNLAQIAVQPIGETGYTALYEKETGMMRFHPNPSLIDYDMHNLSDKLPSFWMVFKPSLRGSIFSGYYDWEDVDGNIRPKFMYMVPVEGTIYMVAATTYIDEFSQPAAITKSKIAAATSQTTEHINRQIRNTRNLSIGLLLAILVVVVGLVFWLSMRITNPIKALSRSAEIIGGGDLDYKVEIKTGDELEDLADSFHKMASDLKRHIEELRITTAEKERFAKELEIARDIQQSFLPEHPPKVKGVEIAALNLPAREVGGDFYDFIPIGSDKWGLVIADVSGKGIPAALFMALSRTLVHASAIGGMAPSKAIRSANNLIAEHDKTSMFVTLFYGILDAKRNTFSYVSAGHNPPFVLPSCGSDTIMLQAKGIALGVVPDIGLEEKEITLGSGDVVVLYTDGVTEAINNEEEQFGQSRLLAIAEQFRSLSASDILQRIQQEVFEFSSGQPQFDDFTLMVLKIA